MFETNDVTPKIDDDSTDFDDHTSYWAGWTPEHAANARINRITKDAQQEESENFDRIQDELLQII